MLVSELEAQRRFSSQMLVLFLAVGMSIELGPDVPLVQGGAEIVEGARMRSHRAEDWWDEQIPDDER